MHATYSRAFIAAAVSPQFLIRQSEMHRTHVITTQTECGTLRRMLVKQ